MSSHEFTGFGSKKVIAFRSMRKLIESDKISHKFYKSQF